MTRTQFSRWALDGLIIRRIGHHVVEKCRVVEVTTEYIPKIKWMIHVVTVGQEGLEYVDSVTGINMEW